MDVCGKSQDGGRCLKLRVLARMEEGRGGLGSRSMVERCRGEREGSEAVGSQN